MGALALRNERQSSQMSKIINDGLDQYGAEPFEQPQLEQLVLKGLKVQCMYINRLLNTMMTDYTVYTVLCSLLCYLVTSVLY